MSKPQAERQEFVLTSTMESVNLAEAAAEKLAQHAGLDEEQCGNIAMAVREATINAVLHGNEYDPTRFVSIRLECTESRLAITIADEGKGLDPVTLPDPLAPENLLRGCGRGIFLMRAFMDEVQFRTLNPGTEICLIKHLPVSSSPSDAPMG